MYLFYALNRSGRVETKMWAGAERLICPNMRWILLAAAVAITSALPPPNPGSPGDAKLGQSASEDSILSANSWRMRRNVENSNINYKADYSPKLPIQHDGTKRDAGKLRLRFLYNNNYYEPDGPILLYLGNEQTIDSLANLKSGILYDMIAELRGSLIFLEHRYYGDKSAPSDRKTYKSVKMLKYLSSAQALADVIDFIPFVRKKFNFSEKSRLIAVGSGYGGALAAWLRDRNPDIVHGAWASSAPLFLFEGAAVGHERLGGVTINALAASGCTVQMLDDYMQAVENATYDELNSGLLIEKKSWISTPIHKRFLTYYLYDRIVNMVANNFWYGVGRIAPRPAELFCKAKTEDDNATPLKRLNYALQAAYGFRTQCVRADVCDNPREHAYRFQKCSELAYTVCQERYPGYSAVNGQVIACRDNFRDDMANICATWLSDIDGYNSKLIDFDAIEDEYGFEISETSKQIIFTDGSADPWSAGGAAVARSDDFKAPEARQNHLFALLINGGVHSAELRRANRCDPKSVVCARVKVVQILRCWATTTPENPREMNPACDGLQSQDFTECGPFVQQETQNCADETRGYPWSYNDTNWPAVVIVGGGDGGGGGGGGSGGGSGGSGGSGDGAGKKGPNNGAAQFGASLAIAGLGALFTVLLGS